MGQTATRCFIKPVNSGRVGAVSRESQAVNRAQENLSVERREVLWGQLLAWYATHRRDLPWRRATDSYAVWVSESMLQQTRVSTVIPYYERFIERFPSVSALAASEIDEVLGLWSGLGYYSRARRLHAAAVQLVQEHDAEFPRERRAAEALPGVGAYTAGAVLSIAYGLEERLIDGNVQRVLARWFAVEGVVTKAAPRRFIEDMAGALVDGVGDPGSWNQALMELGATVCLPQDPKCEACPVFAECEAQARGLQGALPELAPKPAPIDVELEVFVVSDRGRVLLRKRSDEGRMAGLWELPTREIAIDEPRLFPLELEAHLLRGEEVGSIRHSITKHRIQARVLCADLGVRELPPEWAWISRAELEDLGLTGMTSKALAKARASLR